GSIRFCETCLLTHIAAGDPRLNSSFSTERVRVTIRCLPYGASAQKRNSYGDSLTKKCIKRWRRCLKSCVWRSCSATWKDSPTMRLPTFLGVPSARCGRGSPGRVARCCSSFALSQIRSLRERKKNNDHEPLYHHNRGIERLYRW